MVVRKKVQLGGVPIDGAHHVCAFFHTRDERYRTLLPFMQEGIEEGAKQVHLVEPESLDQHRKRLREAGLDVDAAEARGQLEVLGWENTHFGHGVFDQEQMLDRLTGILAASRKEGFPRTRLITDMEWGRDGMPGHAEMMEFEARLSDALRPFDDLVVCTYDLDTFRGGVVMDIMRTHAYVIIGTSVLRNPFYVPPRELLRELRARHAR